ncbi:hypothetical protein [Dysgonomonas sp. BGC7]|nr:hypothetical protein [Dysgonomonas sp. BGC7]
MVVVWGKVTDFPSLAMLSMGVAVTPQALTNKGKGKHMKQS